MWDACFPFRAPAPSPAGGSKQARFARLSYVGQSVGHQLGLPADLPTKVS